MQELGGIPNWIWILRVSPALVQKMALKERASNLFNCNICWQLAKNPVVTQCGHLYCWPCLYRWLHFHTKFQGCPVCEAIIEEHKLVNLYMELDQREKKQKIWTQILKSPFPNAQLAQGPRLPRLLLHPGLGTGPCSEQLLLLLCN